MTSEQIEITNIEAEIVIKSDPEKKADREPTIEEVAQKVDELFCNYNK